MEPVSVEPVVDVPTCEDRKVEGAVDGIFGVTVEEQFVELVIVVCSWDEDIDVRGVAEVRDVGLNEELADVLCEVVIGNSDERRLGRVPSVDMRVSESNLLWLLLEAP